MRFGPILDPLELLRDAGVRFVVLAAFCVESGRLFVLLLEAAAAAVFGVVFNGTFLTVFVDTALLMEDRELRRLARELLRSTSKRRLTDPSLLELPPGLTRMEVALFVVSWEILDGGAPLRERDFSKLC